MKKPPKKPPFITVKEALIASAVIIMTAIAFEKPMLWIYTPPSAPLRFVLKQEARIFSEQITSITALQIATNLQNIDGKPTLIIFYASWCSYCKQLLANISSLKNKGKIDNTHLLFLSVDKDKIKLATYILQYDYNRIFTPQMISPEEELKLKDIITSKGGIYSKAIPYSLFFDGKGKLVSESFGPIDQKQILENLKKASQ